MFLFAQTNKNHFNPISPAKNIANNSHKVKPNCEKKNEIKSVDSTYGSNYILSLYGLMRTYEDYE